MGLFSPYLILLLLLFTTLQANIPYSVTGWAQHKP